MRALYRTLAYDGLSCSKTGSVKILKEVLIYDDQALLLEGDDYYYIYCTEEAFECANLDELELEAVD